LFPSEIKLRAKVAQGYFDRLPNNILKPYIESDNTSVYAQYTVQVPNRERVQRLLNAHSIPTAVHYPVGLHRQPVLLSHYPDQPNFSHTDQAAQKVMSLPMHPYLTEQDQEMICEHLCASLEEFEPA
jgi:UDP-2-acetamido-2-deoxy-ribo-hexuluronate aminotransferase